MHRPVYLDPPFFSNRNYEVIWGDEAEVRSFEDRWEGGINYINWMKSRASSASPDPETHRLDVPPLRLARLPLPQGPDGPHLRSAPLLERDRVVLRHGRAGNQLVPAQARHDLLRYAKSPKTAFYYDQVALPRDPSTMHEPVLLDDKGLAYQRNFKAGKEYRYYLDKGVLPNDWWADIQALNPSANRAAGLPNPEAGGASASDHQRVLAASGDIVLDPFCGCGTTVAVAEKLGRQWIGMDISLTAMGVIQAARWRSWARPQRSRGLPMTESDLRNLKPFEFQNWVIQQVNGTPSPRQVRGHGHRRHLVHVPRADPGQAIRDVSAATSWTTSRQPSERSGKDVGYIVAFSFTRGARRGSGAGKSQEGHGNRAG